MSRPDLTPIYLADGEITIALGEDGARIRRGGATVAWPGAAETIPVFALAKLLTWQPWLRRARVATLRALVKNANMAAGDGRGLITASVQSQLSRAGLLQRSRLWGWDLQAARGLDVWAAIELARREHPKTAPTQAHTHGETP